MTVTKVDEALAKLTITDVERYSQYWTTIQPKSHLEYYQRWLFSFLSVHTTWTSTVRGYELLKDRAWAGNKEELGRLLVQSGVGMHKIRTEGIYRFDVDFWSNPESWYKQENESWKECRDRLMERCHGLGLAKTAFALEMGYPEQSEAVCLDVHMLRLYGKDPKKGISISEYARMESHWVKSCRDKGYPPAIARHAVWDVIQKKPDSTYWTYVFHPPAPNLTQAETTVK